MGKTAALVKKLALLLFMPVLLLAAGPGVGLSGDESGLLAAAFIFGMMFPDMDVLTGLVRTTLKTLLLGIFVVMVVVGFPLLWGVAGRYCPAGAIHQYIPELEASVACQLGLALIGVAGAWVLSEILVIWIPAKDAFHHWTTLIFFGGGAALVARILNLAASPNVLGAGFAIGYGLHLVADMGKEGPEPGWLGGLTAGSRKKGK